MQSLLQDLNENQRQAVIYNDGPLLVLAGAGSGKTRVIIHKIAYLIQECHVSPRSIVAITFTNKAADEMKYRIHSMIGNRADRLWISTFHSMGAEILRNTAGVLGYTGDFMICDDEDRKKRLKDICSEMKSKIDTMSAADKISKLKGEILMPDEVIPRYGNGYMEIAQLYKRYQDDMLRDNMMDFDDLIMNSVRVLRQNAYIRDIYQEKCKYLIVDEFQDTDKAQMELINILIERNRHLCVVGDDDQSIYKFRGAEIKNILELPNTYTDLKLIRLEENYRSTENIINAANSVIRYNDERLGKRLYTMNEKGAPVMITYARDGLDEAAFVTDEITRLKMRKTKGCEIAILYRMHALSRQMEEALITNSIPYRIVGGTGFYQRKEIKDIIAYLKVIVDGSDRVALKRIINIPKRGIGNKTLESFMHVADVSGITLFEALQAANEHGSSKKKIQAFTDLIDEMRAYAADNNLTALVQHLIDKIDYTGYLNASTTDSTEQKKERVENLQEFITKVVLFEKDNQFGISSMERLRLLLEDIALMTNETKTIGYEEQVQLMTIHAAKGLEFEHVFIIGCDDTIFPPYRSLDIQEERRLMYVAMTRAKKTLTMIHAGKRMLFGRDQDLSQSIFLEEIDPRYRTLRFTG